MRQPPRVAVVGAGVIGLATATALLDAGADVRLYERDSPGLKQSVGRTRVFRLAHGDARLVKLAAHSRRLWREWEARFHRRLVGDEGLIVTGDQAVAAWTGAMSDAGVPHATLSIAEASVHLPIARPAGSVALFDPAGGATRARRTIECLRAVCGDSLHLEEVVGIAQTSTGCTVSAPGGSWECDEVIIAAGIETGRLATTAGAGLETSIVNDSRFTYAIAPEFRARSLACWFDTSGAFGPGYTSYGQRVGSTDFYAVAVSWGETGKLAADEESALHREKSVGYLHEMYPGLDPTPVSEIRCSYIERLARDDVDGFMARRAGGVTTLYGTNLFKFAPLIGRLLSQTALTGTLAAELDIQWGDAT
jgi:sarcosine oxidase